jgi:hypothetical protein
MSLKVRSVLLCCTLPLVALATAQAQELRYKFQAGTKTAYVIEQKQSMKMSAMGQDMDMKNNMTMEFSMAVDSVDTATGSAKVKYKFDRVKMSMEGGPFGFEFDSKSEKEPEGPVASMVAPIFQALTGSEISMTVSSRGEISNVALPEKLKDAFANAGGGAGAGNPFSEEQLKQMMNQGVMVLPKEAPTKDTTWDNKFEMKLGPMGTMKVVTKNTYAGKQGQFDKINQKIDMNLEADPNAPMQIKMTTKESSGTVLFDNVKGRVHEVTNKSVNEMDMGGIGTMNMTQNMTMKIKE